MLQLEACLLQAGISTAAPCLKYPLTFSAQKRRGEAEVLRPSSSDALRMTPFNLYWPVRGSRNASEQVEQNSVEWNREAE